MVNVFYFVFFYNYYSEVWIKCREILTTEATTIPSYDSLVCVGEAASRNMKKGN